MWPRVLQWGAGEGVSCGAHGRMEGSAGTGEEGGTSGVHQEKPSGGYKWYVYHKHVLSKIRSSLRLSLKKQPTLIYSGTSNR